MSETPKKYPSHTGMDAPMKSVRKITRNHEIVKARIQGETYAAIAQRFGLSTGRVQQIVQRDEREKRIINIKLNAPLRRIT